jgi:hypothetical protein
MNKFFLLLIFMASICPNGLIAQAQASVRHVNNYETQAVPTYTMGFNQAPITEVFSKIERATGIRFVFNETKLGQIAKVNIAEGAYNLDRLLTLIEIQTGLHFKQISNMIAVSHPTSVKTTPSVFLTIFNDLIFLFQLTPPLLDSIG